MALEQLTKYDRLGCERIHRVGTLKGTAKGLSHPQDAAMVHIDLDTNTISFRIQKGPIKEVGRNGCDVETLAVALLGILEGFQETMPCVENAIAIKSIQAGVDALRLRTKNREARGVEGTNKP